MAAVAQADSPGVFAQVATPEGAPAIRIVGLTKRFSSRTSMAEMLHGRMRTVATVVDDVSFDVQVGEIFGVLGPNGAGKTTIFKMLSTMVLPDDGTATVCGNDIWLEPARVRSLLAAVSSDERSLNWRLSARENLLLFAALQRVPRREADTIVASTLATVGLATTGRKMVAAFSSGMRQRLLIARALLARPKVLLLDEPTRALDPISAQDFRTFLRTELVDRHHCTIILATHNADEALAFCDRVVVLHRGRVLAAGAAAELKTRYGEDRYRVLTTEPDHPCFNRLQTSGMIRRLAVLGRDLVDSDRGRASRTERLAASEDGSLWQVVECTIPGDPPRTANVLQRLLESGVRVARFERVEPSLADLISRIIGQSSRENGDA
jgi:ABC-2 type transport system ATP-binding protein